MATLSEKLQAVLDSKNAIKQALQQKGADVTDDTLFSDYANAISGMQTGGGGGGDAVIVVPKRRKLYDGMHLYIGITEGYSLDGVSLMFGKRNKVTSGNTLPEDGNEDNTFLFKSNGWHSIPQIPIENGNRIPLFQPVFLSTEPAFTDGGIAYYEWSMEEENSMQDWLDNFGSDKSGYTYSNGGRKDEPVELRDLLVGVWGIALAKDGKRTSTYAVFRGNRYNHNDETCYSIWC